MPVNDQGQMKYRRAWRRVTNRDRLLLESAVNFGLPVDFAGRVVRIACSNSDRIMKDYKLRRQQETALLATESPQI